ncbi:MAG: bifunctional methylenetetrahydrofolate dehydrogenase/methenyltetrahydrofolate cyclohydrolase FolD [Clostridia bacterium]|nr:bifunctional methylenetetrahydrofolate dehydrogenase/methenyltetrahydrofolate cyclohydrolase FolD [Clostridia bacterium]
MTARLLDGKAVAARVRARLRERVRSLRERTGVVPGLAVILVGEDPASQIYVRNKERAAAEVGIASRLVRLAAGTTFAELARRVEELNADPTVHGILVQSPLPPPLDFEAVVPLIRPEKDVDGFHPLNLGRLARGRPGLVACTPRGIMVLLEEAGIEVAGRHAVVVGRSPIVGRPMALLLLLADATVTVCHSRTQDLGAVTRLADVLVVAAGRPGLVGPDMVRPGAVVVDVGIHRVDGRIIGDVAPAAAERAAAVTPVPGGVGPMTVAMLLQNTVEAAEAALGVAPA